MTNWTTILEVGGAFILGYATSHLVRQIKDYTKEFGYINQRLDDIEETILTPEQMALQMLKVKMPIKDLPPEVVEMFRQEAEKSGAKPSTPDYLG